MTTPDPDQLKTILFDMDGTLVSSLPVIHYCVNQISNKYVNRTLTIEDVINSFGPPAHAIIRSLTQTLSDDFQAKAVSDYYACYASNVHEKAVLFQGIFGLLSRLRESGKHLALVTGVEKILMECTLDAFDLGKYFEARITRDDVKAGKPDPEGVKLALTRTGSRPVEAMLIGDAPADIVAGKRAGVFTGAALWRPENRGDPRSERPDMEFHSVEQLASFLLVAD